MMQQPERLAVRLVEKLKNWNKLRRSANNKPQVYIVPGNFAYIPVPKCATRSINDLLAHTLLEGQQQQKADKQTIALLKQQYAHHIPKHEIRKRIGSLYTFAIIRHPLERLFSAYKNKVLTDNPKTKVNIFAKHNIPLNIDFLEFVERVCQIPDKYIDRHLRSQTWYLCDDAGLIPDQLIRLENFAREWPEISRKLRLATPPVYNATSSKLLPQMNDYHKQLLMNRYKQDFRYLGYDEI